MMTSCVKPVPEEFQPALNRITDSTVIGNQILQFFTYDGSRSDSVKITYNSLGNPIQLKGSYATYSHLRQRLGYDSQNRLISIIGDFDRTDSTFFEAHKYLYDSQDRVITDSSFTMGVYDTATLMPLTGTSIRAEHFSYDSKNRINKVIRIQQSSTPDTIIITYLYDRLGNAFKLNIVSSMGPGLINSMDYFPVYDSRINPHSLHPVWQLLDRDYSKNNRASQNPYTTSGLPMFITAPAYNPIPTLSAEFLLFSYANSTLRMEYKY
jgi:phage gp37-like protein